MIIFITFVVIFITLVFQGLTLPLIIKWINIGEIDSTIPEDQQRKRIQIRLDELGLNYINEKFPQEISDNELIEFYKNSLQNEISNNQKSFDSVECRHTKQGEVEQYHSMLLEIHAIQRKELFKMRKHKEFEDSEIRKAELQLDLNDLKVTGTEHSI